MDDEKMSELSRQTAERAPDREDERGDVAEPDAPTSAEPNEAMSTILSAEPVTGVQPDACDE